MKIDIRKLRLDELEQAFVTLGEPKYRAKQVYEWLWKKNALHFDDMSNLSKELRTRLEDTYFINHLQTSIVQKSSDGTIKIGFTCADNRVIEGVLIPADNRMTACVSSQVGCSLSCSFCATGFLKRDRNLEAGEIVDQIIALNKEALNHFNLPLSNIVFMGMGEPLLNYDNVMRSIDLITGPDGLGMSSKRITLSTSGVARNIIRMADEGKKFNLALSLHATTNEKRLQIMDINKSNPLELVLEALNYYYKKTGNKITFEYILFNDFNDSDEDAKQLIKLCNKVPSFVNLIEYNTVEEVAFEKASNERFTRFVSILEKGGVDVKVRKSRGKDIDAACGQLANKTK